MKLIHNTGSAHWYRSDGSPAHDSDLRQARKEGLLYSVTSVLKCWPKEHLTNWKVEQAIEKSLTMERMKEETPQEFGQRVIHSMEADLEAAALWGRTIHNLFEHYAIHQKFPDGVAENFLPYCAEIERWFSKSIKKVYFAEERLVNHEFGYAGACDLKAEYGNQGVAYLDFKRRPWWKTGAAFYDTDPVQLFAYAKADGQQFGECQIISVAINRDQPMIEDKMWPAKKHQDYWAKFMACYQLTCLLKNYTPPSQRLLDGRWVIASVTPTPQPRKSRKSKQRAIKNHPELDLRTVTTVATPDPMVCVGTEPYVDIIP